MIENGEIFSRRETAFGNLAFSFFVVALSAQIMTTTISPVFSVINPFVLGLFLFIGLKTIGHFRNPAILLGIALALYSIIPILFSDETTDIVSTYRFTGGLQVNSWAIFGYFLGVSLSQLKPSVKVAGVSQRDCNRLDAVNKIAAVIAAIFSLFLSMLYIAQYGVIIGSDTAIYSDQFTSKMESGTGILLLSLPLSFSSIALVLATRSRLRAIDIALPLLSAATLYVAHGQRKALIAPLIFLLVRYGTIKSYKMLAAWFLVGAISWVIFCYLGFLRFYGYDVSAGLDPVVLNKFAAENAQWLAGETSALLATASAAYDGIVTALPNFGDYLLSWRMSLPQIFFSTNYLSANDRFTYIYNPAIALAGGGYGFSYWGEAYMVGGAALVVGISAATVSLFKIFYEFANRSLWCGFWGAYLIALSYHALWLQRNAFGYFLKEALLYQSLMILAPLTIARFLKTRELSGAAKVSAGNGESANQYPITDVAGYPG